MRNLEKLNGYNPAIICVATRHSFVAHGGSWNEQKCLISNVDNLYGLRARNKNE